MILLMEISAYIFENSTYTDIHKKQLILALADLIIGTPLLSNL